MPASLPCRRLGACLEEAVLDDINVSLYASVDGVYGKYFEGQSWSTGVKFITQEANPKLRHGHWMDRSKFQSRLGFLGWIGCFQSKFLGGKDKPYKFLESSLRNSSQSILFSQSNERDWDGFQIVGELCQGKSSSYKSGFLRLCGQAREVFGTQTCRRFIYGFYVFRHMMELWVFDRSGLYSCGPLDFCKEPSQFLTVLGAYLSMSEEERGVLQNYEGIYSWKTYLVQRG